ncbi:protein dpy-30 homolog [Eurytemora carolleeae]|uniref:protein dpy-30 homolog n=1 Tax=Eurytemora carolleeae TaxID=1294199 RepID=UPI000C789CAA|nr:protein dpy-30 homolog [Eurytemora carolleeae]|eukprot:XP_023341139.1 protein dpy-30 homolog [Eurytemora affinis]
MSQTSESSGLSNLENISEGESGKRSNKDGEQSVSKRKRSDVAGLPTRQYLDQTVVPILLQGLASLARERPTDPIEYLAGYLVRHKKEYETDHHG